MIYLLTPSCYPEHREGSDELLSKAKNTSTSALQIFRASPQQLVFASLRMTKSVKKYIVPK